MSWATRCPSCTTVFRVAEDQLRVSEGFVRCGRCDAVFNAREHLFDLDAVSAPAPLAEAPPPPPPVEVPQPPAVPEEPAWAQSTQLEEPGWAEPTQQLGDPSWAQTTQQLEDDRAEPVWEEPDTVPEDPNSRMRALLSTAEPESAPEPTTPEPAPAAAFASLQQTSKPNRSRVVRALAWLSASLLALALPLQWAWIERDALRAQSPALDALWHKACGSDCVPVSWARIEGLAVAASSLQPTPQGEAYQLKLRIENRAGHSLAMPWLDLSLSDPDGKLLLRRSLSPKELGSKLTRIESGANAELQATFTISGKLAGYEIGLFQP